MKPIMTHVGHGNYKIASDDQHKQIEQLCDTCYNFKAPEPKKILVKSPPKLSKKALTKKMLLKLNRRQTLSFFKDDKDDLDSIFSSSENEEDMPAKGSDQEFEISKKYLNIILNQNDPFL